MPEAVLDHDRESGSGGAKISSAAVRRRRADARQIHRWVMTLFVVLLGYWIISGLTIAIYDATDPHQVWAIEGGGAGTRLSDWAVAAQPVPQPSVLAQGITAALTSVGTMPVASVNYQMSGTIPRLQLAEVSGERATERRFYATTGSPMTPLVADGGPDRHDYVSFRNNMKSWHRGNYAAGLGGQLLGLFSGIALIVLTITGILVYCRMWLARRRTGRSALFWSARDSLWRRIHRWISIVAVALVLNVAISGTILAWTEIQMHVFQQYHIGVSLYPRPTPLPPVSDAGLGVMILPALNRAYGVGETIGTVGGIDLVHRDGRDKAIVTLAGAHPRVLALDALSGNPVADWATDGVQRGNGYWADWHQVLKRIHRGDIIGHFAGRYIDIATGLAILYLVVSGFMMYLDLYLRRRSSDRRALFWR